MNHSQSGTMGIGMLLLFTTITSGQADDPIRRAALQTFENFASANMEAAKKEKEIEIPSKYWTESIKAQNPIRIYLNGLDYDVALRIRGGIEEGKYFWSPVSSDTPLVREDGSMEPRGEFILSRDPDLKTTNFKRIVGK